MPAKADRIEDLYIAEKGNVSSMAEKKIELDLEADFLREYVYQNLLKLLG